MNTRLVISLLITGALGYACGPRSSGDAATTKQRQALTTTSVPKKEGALSAKLVVNVADDAVGFALDVRNATTRSIELAFANGQTYDIVVVDSLGREQWRWARGRMFTQGVRTRLLGGGESIRIAERWTGEKAGGSYTAIARLQSSNHPIEQRVDFVLPAR